MLNQELFNGLPFLVKPENVVRYEDNKVAILDRRVYPFKREFVVCSSYQEVAQAIRDMVTQSGAPPYAVAYAMTLAAHTVKDRSCTQQLAYMKDAAKALGTARPTNNTILYLADRMLKKATDTINEGGDLEAAMLEMAEQEYIDSYADSQYMGRIAASLLHDGDCVLNHCWAETTIVYTMLEAIKMGKKITAICSETRPYLQGARLTSDAISETGVPTTVICDNMVAQAMSQGKINAFISGADRVTMSGHVINKVGTMQAALCAHHFDLPYYCFSHKPDFNAKSAKDVEIEYRNPEDSLYCLGMRTATANVSGYYPAFDVTPPSLVSLIITNKGAFSPYDILSYYSD